MKRHAYEESQTQAPSPHPRLYLLTSLARGEVEASRPDQQSLGSHGKTAFVACKGYCRNAFSRTLKQAESRMSILCVLTQLSRK